MNEGDLNAMSIAGTVRGIYRPETRITGAGPALAIEGPDKIIGWSIHAVQLRVPGVIYGQLVFYGFSFREINTP
ncbi:MAG: hypothetical protein HQ483_10340 [Rhodospirillales bacterium]|nr:hypothetical protein [Rhodospirillales bacterium]